MPYETILVTGGCGYLGSQLIRDLARLPQLRTVRIVDNLQQGQLTALMDLPAIPARLEPARPKPVRPKPVRPKPVRYEFVEGDILDPAVLRLALDGVDAVLHLASVVRTPLSFDNPAWMEQVNHWGTAHLVEACLAMNIRHLVFAGTTAVYGAGGPYTEDYPCRPQGPYARSKYLAEQTILAARGRGLHASIVRLGTLFGHAPVTRFDAVANRFAYHAGVGRALTVYGDGRQRRPLIHVRDASSALLHVLALLDDGEALTLNAANASPSVLELVEAVRRIRQDVIVRFAEQDIRTHVSFEVSSAALLSTGWRPQATLDEGLAEIIERFRGLVRIAPAVDDLEMD